MSYKILIFDADDTLFDFKLSEKEALKKSIEYYGIEYIEEYHLNNYISVNLKIWKEFEEGKITQKALKIDRFRRFFSVVGLDLDPIGFAEVFMERLGQESHIFVGYEEIIKSLAKKYKLIIITNGLTKVQNVRIRQSTIAKYFDKIIISEEIGIAKPNPEIFEKALIDYNEIPKSEILMIGDNLSSDVLGGINFGIDTVWYNAKQKKNLSNIVPTYEIKSLFEFQELLMEVK